LATITILPEGFQPPSGAQASASEPEPVRKVTLANGLRCLIRRDPTTPLVAIQSFSLGGTLFEDATTNGLSRLVALLAPRGTEKRSAEQIARFFDTRGGTFGGASGNNTIYFAAQVLKDDFAEALEVVADVVCHPSFPADELETYRPRLLDQIRRINETWRSELMAYFQSRMFKHSPYRLQAIGSADVVAKAAREDVAAFYRQRITGANTVVAIFGDVDPTQAESLAERYFGSLPAGEHTLPSAEDEPVLAEPALYVKAKPPSRQVAGIGVGFAGMTFADTDDVIRMTVLDTIVSGYHYPTGWLHDALRGGDRGLVYEVHAMSRPGLLPGVFQLYAACQPDKVPEVYRIITEQLDRARAGEFTEEELATAKNIITTTELMNRQTNSEVAMQAALDELYSLGYDYHDRFAERVRGVSLAEVKDVASRFLTTPVVTVVTPAPEKVQLGIEPSAVDGE
jgi:zinc protease